MVPKEIAIIHPFKTTAYYALDYKPRLPVFNYTHMLRPEDVQPYKDVVSYFGSMQGVELFLAGSVVTAPFDGLNKGYSSIELTALVEDNFCSNIARICDRLNKQKNFTIGTTGFQVGNYGLVCGPDAEPSKHTKLLGAIGLDPLFCAESLHKPNSSTVLTSSRSNIGISIESEHHFLSHFK